MHLSLFSGNSNTVLGHAYIIVVFLGGGGRGVGISEGG